MMYQIIRKIALLACFVVTPIVVCAATAVAPANANSVGDVAMAIEGNTSVLWRAAFGLVIVLAGYIWKREHRELSEYKKMLEKRFDSIDSEFKTITTQLGSGIRMDYFKEQQLSIHSSIDRLRADIERARMDDLRNNQTTFTELWNDMKEQRQESQRISQEVFHQIQSSRERMQSHEVNIAQKYHTKEEISDLLTDKISPVTDELRSLRLLLQGPTYTGPNRR